MQSFSPVLAGLGLRCLFVVDEEAECRLRDRVRPRNSSYVRATPSMVLTFRHFRKIGRLGAQARIDKFDQSASPGMGAQGRNCALAES